MGQVFIAYSGADMRFLTQLRDDLRVQVAHTLYIAEWDAQVGADLRQAIWNNLDMSQFFVPLISRSFLQRPEPRRELSAAIDLMDAKKLEVIPLVIDKMEHLELPPSVRGLKYIPHKPYDAQLADLVNRLEARVEPLANIDAMKRYVDSAVLTPDEMVDLAKQAINSTWRPENTRTQGAKYIADKLEAQRHVKHALAVYDALIERLPANNGFLVKRSTLRRSLGSYKEADDDCANVLSRDPDNTVALFERFRVRHAWAVAASTPVQAQPHKDQIRVFLRELERVNASTRAFAGYVHALAQAAELCAERNFADKAWQLVRENVRRLDTVLGGPRQREGQVNLLRSLQILERLYSRWETDKVDGIISLRKRLEDRWQIFSY